MREAVLDASVVLKWFHADGEGHLSHARELRDQFQAGDLRVLAPPLLWLEIVNVAARRWRWPQTDVEQVAASLSSLGFELIEPDILMVARWAAQGLTAHDAAYVAVAEYAGATLITDDHEIVRVASELASPLAG